MSFLHCLIYGSCLCLKRVVIQESEKSVKIIHQVFKFYKPLVCPAVLAALTRMTKTFVLGFTSAPMHTTVQLKIQLD